MLGGTSFSSDSLPFSPTSIETATIELPLETERDPDEVIGFRDETEEVEAASPPYAAAEQQSGDFAVTSQDDLFTSPEVVAPVGFKQSQFVEERGEAAVEAIGAAHTQGVDPWKDPLPVWDYSRNEYPILLSPEGRSKPKRLWIIGAIVVLLACLATAYTLFAPSESGEEKAPKTVTTDDAKNALITHDDVLQAPQPVNTPAATGDAGRPYENQPQAQGAQDPIAAKDQEDSAQTGAYSLQAMASKDEDEAKRLAERLQKTGVPAYVTSAEIGARGKWYRVRVGRFASTEQAKRYAAEYGLRARTGGVDAQLMVCNYEKP